MVQTVTLATATGNIAGKIVASNVETDIISLGPIVISVHRIVSSALGHLFVQNANTEDMERNVNTHAEQSVLIV